MVLFTLDKDVLPQHWKLLQTGTQACQFCLSQAKTKTCQLTAEEQRVVRAVLEVCGRNYDDFATDHQRCYWISRLVQSFQHDIQNVSRLPNASGLYNTLRQLYVTFLILIATKICDAQAEHCPLERYYTNNRFDVQRYFTVGSVVQHNTSAMADDTDVLHRVDAFVRAHRLRGLSQRPTMTFLLGPSEPEVLLVLHTHTSVTDRGRVWFFNLSWKKAPTMTPLQQVWQGHWY